MPEKDIFEEQMTRGRTIAEAAAQLFRPNRSFCPRLQVDPGRRETERILCMSLYVYMCLCELGLHTQRHRVALLLLERSPNPHKSFTSFIPRSPRSDKRPVLEAIRTAKIIPSSKILFVEFFAPFSHSKFCLTYRHLRDRTRHTLLVLLRTIHLFHTLTSVFQHSLIDKIRTHIHTSLSVLILLRQDSVVPCPHKNDIRSSSTDSRNLGSKQGTRVTRSKEKGFHVTSQPIGAGSSVMASLALETSQL